MERILTPPPLYELVVVDKTDSARAHAERLAAQGAEEGTLVWAKSQTEGLGRNNRFWMSGYRNLHLGLILQPEQPFTSACQLSLVATICTAMAIADQAEPMAELRYRWPNDVLLNRGKVAGITLSGSLSSGNVPEWMVLGVNVNVFDHPKSLGFDSASMRGEGFENHDRVQVAETFCRQFLSWANRWADDGFAPIRKAWLMRARGDPLMQTIRLQDAEITGTFDDMDEEGTLTLHTTEHQKRGITLAAFFQPDFVTER
jgi:BirA family biotin operon repressor/biotin-[acetyl-CoA-carboxylase] ligase